MSRTFTCELCGESRWDTEPECDCIVRLTNDQIAAKRRMVEQREYEAEMAEDYYSDPIVQAEMDRFFNLGIKR